MAIKANELRIGNWVAGHLGDILKQMPVTSVQEDNVIVNNGKGGGKGNGRNYFHPSELQPIPLTPELLEKCGFVDMNGEYVPSFKKEPIELEIVENEFMCRLRHDWNEHGTSLLLRTIKYLHQLQNLYFSLTGEELEIKP